MLAQIQMTRKGEILIPQRPVFAKIYPKFEAFRLAEKYADVTIRCEDKPFKCHRMVLAAASDIFDAVFYDNVNEEEIRQTRRQTKAGVLDESFDLKDLVRSTFVIRKDIFQKIIQFLYTGSVEITTTDLWLEFLRASESLQICCVDQICLEYLLMNRMSVRSTLEVLKFLFGTKKRDLLANEFCDAVAKQLRIFHLHDTFPQLSFEIFSSILEKVSEGPSMTLYNSDDVLFNCIIQWVLHDPVERLTHLGELFKHLRGPRNRFENVSLTTMESTFSELLKLISPRIATGPDKIPSHAVSYCREASVAARKLYIYTKSKGEASMRVFSIHRNDGQDECKAVGRIEGWQITESHNPWIRSVAVKNHLYNLYYGRRSSAQDNESQNQSFDYCTTELNSAVGLRPPPVIFDDVKLCAMRDKYIYAYNQTLSRRRCSLAVSASTREWTTFSDEEIAAGIYMYHCELDRWFPVPTMSRRVVDACTVVHNDRLFVIGGRDATDIAKRVVQAYDSRSGNWHYLSSSENRWFIGADCCVLNDRIYVTGGECNTLGPVVAEFDVHMNRWGSSTTLSTMMQHHRMVPYSENELWTMGSFDEREPFSGDLFITIINPKLAPCERNSSVLISAAEAIVGNPQGIILDAVSFE